MSQPGKLLAEQAQVQTARVEIKMLTVGGKQMTQAVFRQLRREDLIDRRTLTLRGQPWGWVNYHPPQCTGTGLHLHVVWQKDLELRHDRVIPDGWNEGVAELRHHCQVATDRIGGLLSLRTKPDTWQSERWLGIDQALIIGDEPLVTLRFAMPGEERWRASVSGETAKAIRSYWLSQLADANSYRVQQGKEAAGALDREISRHRDDLIDWGVAAADADDISLLWRWLQRQTDKQEWMKARWKRLYATLLSLDQLFIAV